LHKLFQRSDLLVTGNSIMHDAGNMLLIARAHGRFLGATKMTPHLSKVVAACLEEEFETLPISTEKAGHEIKATFRHLRFEAKVKFTPAEWRRQRGIRGRRPTYRKVHFWMRAAVILDTERREREAKRRSERIAAYEAELKWTLDHLNKGRYYGDPEWVVRTPGGFGSSLQRCAHLREGRFHRAGWENEPGVPASSHSHCRGRQTGRPLGVSHQPAP
jgi:hypothetical protein